jgi:RNA polymerase sigma-70 factor (ECF subfamily)
LDGRNNQEWIAELQSTGAVQEAALADLRRIIIKGLRYGLSKWLSPPDPNFEALAQDTAQETLLKVLENLETFEGRSRFTTWVHKIAIRTAISELRRKRWQNLSMDAMIEEVGEDERLSFLVETDPGPGDTVEQSDMLERVKRIIVEELTEKQRRAIVATTIKGVPMAEVARRMGSNRNALYKLLHDARKRLKAGLEREGLPLEEVLKAFE